MRKSGAATRLCGMRVVSNACAITSSVKIAMKASAVRERGIPGSVAMPYSEG